MSNDRDFTVNIEDLIKQRQILKEALCLPVDGTGIIYYITEEFKKSYPHKALLHGRECAFNVEAFARADLCTMLANEQIHDQRDTGWNPGNNKLYQIMNNGSLQIIWKENQIDVVLVGSVNYWILADTQEVAHNFFSAVCQWNCKIDSDIEILEFKGGGWQKSQKLFQAIKNTTFDDLILEETLKQKIQNQFNKDEVLASIKDYEEWGVSWKRGYMFIGPPGNGKTLTIKAIVNQMELPCLYVRSFDSYGGISQDNINRVFQGARRYAPCILVLEDLDSLVNKQNRSFFLNEVDGFDSNHGVIIVATTNYPERLDSAIIDRPSRFDELFSFNLPGLSERVDYLQLWNKAKLKSQMRLSDTKIPQIAELADGFSFAYLQELFFSSRRQWMRTQTPGEMDRIMVSQIPELKRQISLSEERKTNNEGKVKQFFSLFKTLSQQEQLFDRDF